MENEKLFHFNIQKMKNSFMIIIILIGCLEGVLLNSSNLSIDGYARIYGSYKNFYNNVDYPTNSFIIGGISREPTILLNFIKKPTLKSQFKIEYFLFSPMDGDLSNKEMSFYQSLQFTGKYNFHFGNIGLSAGSLNWIRLSPFTLWNHEYKDDIFERSPWEPNGNAMERYQSFYKEGNISRDIRWGKAPTQGYNFKFNFSSIGTNLYFIYGKSDFSGGLKIPQFPKNLLAIRIDKSWENIITSINYVQHFSKVSPTINKNVGYNVFTTEIIGTYHLLEFNTEIGIGQYYSPTYKKKISESIQFTGSLKSFIPIKMQFFQIGNGFVNLNSAVANSSIQEVQPLFQDTINPDLTTFEGIITEIGQLVNNRKGLNLWVSKKISDWMLTISSSVTSDIQDQSPFISFPHLTNRRIRSEFEPYSDNSGAYNRITNIFLRSYEKIEITETDIQKDYNGIEFSIKYQNKFFNNIFILSYLNSFNSVQNKFSLLPIINNSAYLRMNYQELLSFVQLSQNIMIIGLASFEQIIANSKTELAENGYSLDQLGTGFGVGLDISLNNNTGIYFRHRWFEHTDRNFINDEFNGQESTIELKVYF